MNRPRLIAILATLLAVSISLNAWQFLRPAPVPEVTTVAKVVRAPAEKSIAGIKPGGPTGLEELEKKPAAEAPGQQPDLPEGKLAAVTEDLLLHGDWSHGLESTSPSPTARVTPERMKELAKQEPSKAEKFRVHAVLRLPGERVVDFGSSEIEPGATMRFEKVKEFPFPTSIKIADLTPQVAGAGVSSFPVHPTTPGTFEFRNTGVTIEVDVTPAAGALVLGGVVTHRTFDGFGRMPGELFSPIYTTATSATGKPEEIILTENKVLQPQFSVAETPFLAAAAAGQPCQVPVRMTFGQTILELTCTPVE